MRCVGYDPTTKREIPRSYVYFLETRLSYFESLLKQNNVRYNEADVFNADSRPLGEHNATPARVPQRPVENGTRGVRKGEDWDKKQDDKNNIDKLVSNIGMVSVQGASDPRYLGSTSGISFARVVLAAVKSSMSSTSSERAGTKPSKPLPNVASAGGSSMRDSYFGLQTKPSIKEAAFPDRALGEKLVHLYFEHANPQIPILHRGDFMDLVDHAYSVDSSKRTSRELYLLNIVFAVGSGIIWGSSDAASENESVSKRPRLASQQAHPEEYHASAIVHLGTFLSPSGSDAVLRPGGDLEELQAVLLLAAFALLRPVAPGLWYIVGVAMRLALDLGLHYEDGTVIDDLSNKAFNSKVKTEGADTSMFVNPRERGRREWMRDLRRRLWWCTYNFDRLVSTCVGRPFGITDQVVTTEFPSLLDDKYITRTGFLHQPRADEPSYKLVAHHYFRLRLLQSEILQVLQHQQAQQARANGTNRGNDFIHTKLPSPFLSKYESFRSWRANIDQRLYEWKEAAPHKEETGVSFDKKFLELNYWQAVIMLYRQSLSVPAPFANELSPTDEVGSPGSMFVEDKDDEDHVFLKCAEAGQKTLKLYRQLHRQRLVNYTYLATHHLFMAGISFLYAVWHSPAVRTRLSLDDFDFTVLAATSVLGDLMEKCPPAEACRDAFERMSKATVQMCLSTPGYGFSSDKDSTTPRPPARRDTSMTDSMVIDPQLNRDYQPIAPKPRSRRPPPQFDMDLKGLFPADIDTSNRPSASFPANLMRKRQRQTSQGASQPNPVPYLQQTPSASSHFSTRTPADPNMNQSRMSSFSQNSQQYFPQTSYNPDFMDISTLPGMDFLNFGSSSEANASAISASNPNTATSMSNSLNQSSGDDWSYGMSPGLDLGFGVGTMGLDFQHDWSNGVQDDLFDGFFFGNSAGNGMG